MIERRLTLLPTPMMFPPITSVGVSEFAIGCGVDIWSVLVSVPCCAPEMGAIPGLAEFVLVAVAEVPNEEFPKDDEFPKAELLLKEPPKELPPCAVPPKEDCAGLPNKEFEPAVATFPNPVTPVPRGCNFRLPINCPLGPT